jgi:hypothetical protein
VCAAINIIVPLITIDRNKNIPAPMNKSRAVVGASVGMVLGVGLDIGCLALCKGVASPLYMYVVYVISSPILIDFAR